MLMMFREDNRISDDVSVERISREKKRQKNVMKGD